MMHWVVRFSWNQDEKALSTLIFSTKLDSKTSREQRAWVSVSEITVTLPEPHLS